MATDWDVYAVSLLERWGEWWRAISVQRLGYPTHSHFTHIEPRDAEFDDPEIEKLNILLCDLKKDHPLEFSVLLCEYALEKGTKLGAVHIGIGETTYKKKRDQAVSRISTALRYTNATSSTRH